MVGALGEFWTMGPTTSLRAVTAWAEKLKALLPQMLFLRAKPNSSSCDAREAAAIMTRVPSIP